MPREKYRVGDQVELFCQHTRDGSRVSDWLAGRVVSADHRMVAVRFDTDVFANTGWPVADRTLWCTHGSRNLRRDRADSEQAGSEASEAAAQD
jgi:hypothetical protein